MCLIQVGHPRFSNDNLEKNKAIYTRIAHLASKHACSPPQLALAWLLHQGKDIVPIPGTCLFMVFSKWSDIYQFSFIIFLFFTIGTTKSKNLEANIGSLKVKLTKEDLKEISDAVTLDEVAGDRELSALSKYAWKFANTPPK